MAQKYELYCAILIHGNAFMRTLIVAVSGLLRICEHFKGFSTYQVEMIIFVWNGFLQDYKARNDSGAKLLYITSYYS